MKRPVLNPNNVTEQPLGLVKGWYLEFRDFWDMKMLFLVVFWTMT